MDRLIIIDGNSLVNRAFYALPPMLNDGKPTQAVYGFATMLIKMIQDYSPKYMAVAFDLPAPTFRHKRYDGYKATRKGMPPDLAVQMPTLKTMLSRMGIKMIEKEGYEADDLIGTLSRRSSAQTYIVTGDRDSLQLIDDTTRVVLTKRGITETLELDEEGLKREFDLTPAQIIEYKAIAGDSSDCISGVTGIGDKGAHSLLKEYESLDGVYANIDKIGGKLKERLIAGKEQAYLSKELATIDTNAPIDCELSECLLSYPFDYRVKEFFIETGFKSLVKRDEIFAVSDDKSKSVSHSQPLLHNITDYKSLKELFAEMRKKGAAAVEADDNGLKLAVDGENEYRATVAVRLDDVGISYTECAAAIKELFEDEQITKVVYDLKKLKKYLDRLSVSAVNCRDVKLEQYVADVSVPNETAEKLLKNYDIPTEAIAAGLMRLDKMLTEEIEKFGLHKVFYDLEMPLVDVLYGMEKEGFRLDVERLKEFSAEYTAEIEKLTEEIYAMCGTEFNINSPKQLGKVLFEDMGLNYPRKGAVSTGADVLQQIINQHPVIEKILTYRTVSKLNSTYIEGLLKLADKDGVVRTEFRQTSTATGRLSSVEPNLQNIPVREERGKKLRALFAAREGRTLVSADYSQIELRLLAHLSGDDTLVKAYYDGDDVHAITASMVFGVPLAEVTSKMRREAKAVNFGIIYGISDFGLSQNINISRAGAKKYIDEYFKRFPTVAEYLDESVRLAKERGYAVTLMGRRRKIPELFSSQYTVRQFGERVAMNTPLQGGAADIIKAAMIAVHNRLKAKKSKLILQIHDELIVEAAEEEVDEVKEILRDCMENAVKLKVPLIVDIGVGKSWLDC